MREGPERLPPMKYVGSPTSAEVQDSSRGTIDNKSWPGLQDVYSPGSLASSSRRSGTRMGSRTAHMARNAPMSASGSLAWQA